MESPSTCSCSEPKASRMARASSTPNNDWEAFVRAPEGYIIKCVLWVLGRQSGDQGRNLIPNVAEVALQDRNINHKQNHMKHHETRCTLAQGIYPIWNPVLIWSKKLKMNMLSGMNVKRKTTSSMTSSWCLMCVCVCVSYCLNSMFTATLQYVPCYKTWSELNVLDQQIKGTMLDISKYLLSHFQFATSLCCFPVLASNMLCRSSTEFFLMNFNLCFRWESSCGSCS